MRSAKEESGDTIPANTNIEALITVGTDAWIIIVIRVHNICQAAG